MLLALDCVRTFFVGKSSRSRATMVSIKLSAGLQKILSTCTETLSCMGFDGPRGNAWNLFTVKCKRDKSYVLLEQESKVVKRALYSKKEAENGEDHQSLGEKNVCSFFRIAFKLELFILFSCHTKSSSKIFLVKGLVKRWHFELVFTLKREM